jgi:hypothetical protein
LKNIAGGKKPQRAYECFENVAKYNYVGMKIMSKFHSHGR